MSTKLFVGGLSWNTTDDGLQRAFGAYGDIQEAVVIRDRDTGRSRGFGFVTFHDRAGAEKAIEELDGSNLDGREIRVSEAQDKRRGGGRERGEYRGGWGDSGGYGGGHGGDRGGRRGGRGRDRDGERGGGRGRW